MSSPLRTLVLCCFGGAAAFRPQLAPTVRRHAPHRAPMMVAAVADADGLLTPSLMKSLPDSNVETGGAGGQSTWEGLLRLDEAWTKLRTGAIPPPRQVVFEEHDAAAETAEFDVVVCGGNIGILLATALALRGLRVAVLEAGVLRGRDQDWNASRKEVGAAAFMDAQIHTRARPPL